MNALNASQAATKPFTRVITTPASFPWDQHRAAQLEARHTSPVSGALAGSALAIVVKRLEPWKPGTAGRFVAVYLKGTDHKAGLSFTVDVQGRDVRVDIPSQAGQSEALKQKLWIVGTAVTMLVCLVGQGLLTLNRRTDVAERLTQLEAQTERATRLASGSLKAKQNAQALAELGLTDRTIHTVIEDLRTVTTSRDPAARIERFLWEGGDWAVEVRGEAPPFQDASAGLQRAPEPVRRGVWLWVKTRPQPSEPAPAQAQRPDDY